MVYMVQMAEYNWGENERTSRENGVNTQACSSDLRVEVPWVSHNIADRKPVPKSWQDNVTCLTRRHPLSPSRFMPLKIWNIQSTSPSAPWEPDPASSAFEVRLRQTGDSRKGSFWDDVQRVSTSARRFLAVLPMQDHCGRAIEVTMLRMKTETSPYVISCPSHGIGL